MSNVLATAAIPPNQFTPQEAALLGCDGSEYHLDSLTCILSRASAVVSLLQTQILEDGDEQLIPSQQLAGVLWAVDGLIQQAQAVTERVIHS